MNEGNCREYGGCCYFHPKEVGVGVCHLCLNERLLLIAAKQGAKSKSSKRISHSFYNLYHKPKPYVTLPKLFAIASFFSPKDNSHHHHHHRHRHRRESDHHSLFDDADATSTSLEEDESFISIKFGDNGVASWDKGSSTVSKMSLEQHGKAGQTTVKDATIKGSDCNDNGKSVVEHGSPRAAALRWRKRIGQLLQVIRWRKSSKANVGGGGNNSKVVEGVRGMTIDDGWIRTSKSRTKG